ncbi:MAG: serine/threonine protein kinase [Bryobacteraceae bacterium]
MSSERRAPLDTASMGGVTQACGASPSPGFEPGARVGEYEIVAAIGAGGMGEVYRVRNVISDRTEAMKVLLPSLTKEPDLAERFMREIKVQAALNHPNIASLHTAFHYNNQIVMVMEFVEGLPLDQRLAKGPIPLPDCLAWVTQVLRALSYAHERGVIHRDIKPSNIMLMPDGSVKLMDFGIAQVASDPKLTGTGVTVGSPYYMSPEQIRGGTPDARSDIYSLGITLYELVTGRRPIQGDSEFSIKSAHLNDVPTPPIALDHTLPPELNEIILMSIAKLPERRFQTANAFLNALESVRAKLDGHAAASAAPYVAPAVTMPAVERVPKSHRALYMALGAIAAVIVLAVLGLEGPKWFRTSAHQEPAVVTTAEPVPVPLPAAPATPPSASPMVEASPQVVPAQTHARPQQLPRQPPPAQPLPEPPAAAPAAPAAPAVPSAPVISAADLQKVEDRMSQITARMNSLDRSLQRLEQNQNASGLGMRSDWAQARDMMHSFFNQAESALRNQDPAAAMRFLDRAETQVDKLAKALNQ